MFNICYTKIDEIKEQRKCQKYSQEYKIIYCKYVKIDVHTLALYIFNTHLLEIILYYAVAKMCV